MHPKPLGVVLLLLATAASGQTLYRTVTADGKVTYSDTSVTNNSPNKPSQVRVYSADELGAANAVAPAGGNPTASGGDPACQPDTRKYCAQSQGKQAFECLLDHQQDISDACYEALKRRIQAGPADQGGKPSGNQVCRQDAQQFCQGIQPGDGRIVDCLLDHQNDLSDACYGALGKRKHQGRH